MEIHLAVALDFSSGSGHAKGDSESQELSMFEKAISLIGGTLAHYDSDNKFPVYGLGGVPKFMGNDKVSHCFPLNGEVDDPNIVGIENILATYRQNLPNIELPNSPTQLAPVLENFKKYVEEFKANNDKNGYGVLLILTGGAIMHLEETKSILVELSALPCSVIIVGLGEGINK